MFNLLVTNAELKEQVEMLEADVERAESINERLEEELRDVKQAHKDEVKDLTTDYDNKIKDMERDAAIKASKIELEKTNAVNKANQSAAEAQKEVQMLREMVDLSGDIYDVKDLVTGLLNKLPEVKIDTLAVSAGAKKEGK
jgi:chromosome segregation ATPase